MEDKHFDCRTCVNRASPLCELCIHVQTPSGIDTKKPTYYIAQSEVTTFGGRGMFHEKPTNDPETESLAKYLMKLLCQRVPIPTGVVMAYNRKTEQEE